MLAIYFVTSVLIEHTWFIQGDAASFDPIGAFDSVKHHAGSDVQFTSMQADYVNSNGTLNLNANYTPAPKVDYKFVKIVDPPKNAPPLGVGQSGSGTWYLPVAVEVYKPWTFRSLRSSRTTSTRTRQAR